MGRTKPYTFREVVWQAGRKKGRVTSAITLLNKISVDAMGRDANKPLIGALQIAIEELKEYRNRLEV